METTESCTCCEKFGITFKASHVLSSLMELPNTYDPATRTHVWKQFGIMAYAIVPRSFHEASGEVDLYLCADEDELDDLDSLDVAHRLLQEHVLPAFPGCKEVHLLQPALAAPMEIGCWKLRHAARKEE